MFCGSAERRRKIFLINLIEDALRLFRVNCSCVFSVAEDCRWRYGTRCGRYVADLRGSFPCVRGRSVGVTMWLSSPYFLREGSWASDVSSGNLSSVVLTYGVSKTVLLCDPSRRDGALSPIYDLVYQVSNATASKQWRGGRLTEVSRPGSDQV